MRNNTSMLVLMPNERILLQREASITIKYKPRGGEKGKGIFYITNIRIVFEDNNKGIMLQVYPFNNELQAYRVKKGLMGGEKLMLDIQRVVNGNTLLAVAEVEFKRVGEAINAINAMLVSSGSSSSMGNVTNVGSGSKMSSASSSKEEKGKEEPMEVMEWFLKEGEEILAVINDIDYKSYMKDIENGKVVTKLLHDEKGMRLVMTNIQDIGITPEGWVGCSFNPRFEEIKVEGLTVKVVRKSTGEIEQEFTFKKKEDVDTYINTRKKEAEWVEEFRKKNIDVTKLPRTKKLIIKTRGHEPPIIEDLPEPIVYKK